MSTSSSTEIELAGADMYIPEIFLPLYFIKAQGYGVECIDLYQDKNSTQLLMKNGLSFNGTKPYISKQSSSSSKTK
jgi:hypothetical protein